MTTLTRNRRAAAPANRIGATSFLTRLRSAAALWRSRRALGRATSAQLEDAGITPAEAAREVRRPVWDVPANWRL